MRFGPILAMMGLCLAVAACNNPSRTVASNEDMMAASGFKIVPVNTPAREAAFKNLPPHQFVRQTKDGRPIYLYADSSICGCLYVGGQKAYGTYNQRRLAKRVADQQLQDVQEQNMIASESAMSSWDWAAWNDGFPVGWWY